MIAQESQQLRLMVLDAAGAIVPDATVMLIPNRCSKECKGPLPIERIEMKTALAITTNINLQAGVIYDLVVLKEGLTPVAKPVQVSAGRRESLTVKLLPGSEWSTVDVCVGCPAVEVPPSADKK